MKTLVSALGCPMAQEVAMLAERHGGGTMETWHLLYILYKSPPMKTTTRRGAASLSCLGFSRGVWGLPT